MYVAVRIREFKGANKTQKAAKFLKEKTQCTRRASYEYHMDEDDGYMIIEAYDNDGTAKGWCGPWYIGPSRFESYCRNCNVKQIFFCADTIPVGEL